MIRIIGYLFGIGVVAALAVAGAVALFITHVSSDLPNYEVLANYQPPVTTRVHAANGGLMAEYARERRLFLPIAAVPDRVKAAFLSAEDKNFYTHPGLDVQGLARAIVNNLRNGTRQGASTITQQVAKNFLLTTEQTYERKVKEAILAFRIEQAYSKDRILELYLNEIFLGFGSYGIASAALSYFDKSVNELTVAEAAYLAALPKAPNNYHPFRHRERAVDRRNWVIGQMLENGYITQKEADEARASALGVKSRQDRHTYLFAGEYFTEEVRREIIDRYGVDELYEGGLSVRTTIDPDLQKMARKSMQKGLIEFDVQRGYRGPYKKIELGDDWGSALAQVEGLYDVPEWQLAVVLETGDNSVEIGLQPGRKGDGSVVDKRETGTIAKSDMKWAMRHRVDGSMKNASSPAGVLEQGDVVFVEKTDEGEGSYRLRQPPEIEGGLVAMDPHTGRVLAMVGGFSFAESEFNRATQAMRQPGSSFKPIVYAAALDNGYTPASVVMDAPITIKSGNTVWEPKNYGGKSAGPSTLRLGIERSRNLMTVRLAKDMGIDLVAEYAERFGIYDKMGLYLPNSLGSSETTVMRMATAYSIMANGGKQIRPSLIDRIQDRYGKTVYKHDQRGCEGCSAKEWSGQSEPTLVDNREQVLDPMTAYQITSMMEGVAKRGTAAKLADIGFPVAGKTGTTNDEKDAWFVGFTPDLVVALYLGYDTPRPMGHGSTGGGLAVPIFKDFMSKAHEGKPNVDFQVPEGMLMIPIDRRSGMRTASSGGGNVIIEAFKPGTGPADVYNVIGMETVAQTDAPRNVSQESREIIQSAGGGLY
ncbi:penicillin-binding protein 1A [Notoacmeibacter ruber]|uniref:Penicillin-binding protein 1A n=1 Tax=Notoacmeibacter ruber TaxID=2670375 RepID=A0A3L7JH03_9HYPH|nr:penicillin-binding protein 1A [Notoacmeibacter ruber]RLQ87762.1 penicillin-binding protein 1A [Notoacmeibacter ruber]